MKKLLSLLGSLGIVGGASATIVACGAKPKETPKENPIEATKKKLTTLIEEAEGLVDTSKKETIVTETLKTAIDNAREILVKEGVTEVELTNEIATLQNAIDKFNLAQDLDKKLQDKIDAIKQNKTETESKNNQNGWDSISEKSQTDFSSVITEAEAIVKKAKLTKEEVAEQFEKLDQSIANFKLTLPQNIVSQAINLKTDSIKDLIFKGWSYDSFFDAKAQEKDKNARLVNLLINDAKELAKEHHYSEAEQAKLGELIVKHFADKVKMVYLNEQDGQQKIKKVIDQDDKKMQLEQIFHKNVQEEFPDADLADPGFWDAHPKLSLGIKFGVENLNPETQEFWSFNLIGDLTEKDQEYVQKLFREAETRDGGSIILEIRKGLSKDTGTFTGVVNGALRQKVFYGKRFLLELNVSWNWMPNDEQVKNGVENWTTGKDMDLRVNKSFNPKLKLFNIKAKITMNIR